MMTQCKLQKRNKFQTAFIPTKFAKLNQYVELLGDNGWKIISVGVTYPTNLVRSHERDYKKTRNASDI